MSGVWESNLQGRLGVSRDELRRMRKAQLAEGPDWSTVKNRVVITEAGLAKLEAALGLSQKKPAPEPAPHKNAAARGDYARLEASLRPATEPQNGQKTPPADVNDQQGVTDKNGRQEELVTLHVWRGRLPNKRIVEAFFPGKDPQDRRNIVRVRVRDNTNFVRVKPNGDPFDIPCRHIRADLYELARPCPRWRGVW